MHVDGPYKVNFDGQVGGSFVWNDYGLELTFPTKCLRQNVEITINTLLPFRNEIHPGVYIVSEIFKFHCNVQKFDKSFTLCLQHCINLQSLEDCRKMCFIIQHGNTTDMRCGHFEVGSSCGTIKLNRFCCISIAWMTELWKYINVQMNLLPVPETPDGQDNSLQTVSTQPGSNSSEVSSNKFSTSKNQQSHQQCNSTLSPSEVDTSKITKEQEKAKPTPSPAHKYEEMFALPKDHSQLAKWNGIYSIYVKKAAWRKVCS